jgi:dimethyl sulfoxide reductase iron-sulfur subunit
MPQAAVHAKLGAIRNKANASNGRLIARGAYQVRVDATMNEQIEQGSMDTVTRWRLLKAMAGAGVVGAVGLPRIGSGSEATPEPDQVTAGEATSEIHIEAPPAEASGERQWAFVIDLRLCDGCDKCTEACQKDHFLAPDQKWIDVYRMTSSSGQPFFMPRLCMHCENPPCEKVCPVGATFMNQEGVVLVDQKTCIGCRMCMAACPYDARYFNWDESPPVPEEYSQPMPEFPVPQRQGTVGKCVLCVHYSESGQLPACVEACSMGALYIADLRADVATNGNETVKLSTFLNDNDAIRLKEELGTRPRVFYILGHGQNYHYGA